MISSLRSCNHMHMPALLKFEILGILLEKRCLRLKCIDFAFFNETYREYGTRRQWGRVWGTSVTVPVTISTSYVPQTKLGNILFLLCFLLLCSPNGVWEHIVFTRFLIIIIIIILFFLICSPVRPEVFSETVHPTKLKPFQG